jgi:hypothetical protein
MIGAVAYIFCSGGFFLRTCSANTLATTWPFFFAKDILAIVLYISFIPARRNRPVKSFRPPFLVPLLIFIWFGIIQMFNPNSTSIFYGLLGMKVYFLYVPLMFIGYGLIESEEDLQRFLTYNIWLFMAVVGLGIAQSILGPKFLNPIVL